LVSSLKQVLEVDVEGGKEELGFHAPFLALKVLCSSLKEMLPQNV
jgi:hypothetical protein